MAVYKLQQKNSEGAWVDVTLGGGTTAESAFISSIECCCGFAWISIRILGLNVTGRICVPINAKMAALSTCIDFIDYITTRQNTPWPIWNWIPDVSGENIQVYALTASRRICIFNGNDLVEVTYEVLTGSNNFTPFLFTNHF